MGLKNPILNHPPVGPAGFAPDTQGLKRALFKTLVPFGHR